MVGLTSQVMGKIAALALALGLAACIILTCPLICLTQGVASGIASVRPTGDEWPAYGGQAAQDHYSSLSQINRENVKQLKIAWSFDTGETGSMETTPVIVGHVLYAYTPSLKVVALYAASGKSFLTLR